MNEPEDIKNSNKRSSHVANGLPKCPKVPKKRPKETRQPLDESDTTIIHTNVSSFKTLVQQLTVGDIKDHKRTPARDLSDFNPIPISYPAPTQTTTAAAAAAATTSVSAPSTSNNDRPSSPFLQPPSKSNPRLRSLAPPPIQPAADSTKGFRPYPPPWKTGEDTAPPNSYYSQMQTTDSLSRLLGRVGIEPFGGMSQMAAYPGSAFSPRWPSPMHSSSPRDMFLSYMDSPGSLAMQELAMKALADSSSVADSSSAAASNPHLDVIPSSSSIALPSPNVYPMLQGGMNVTFPFPVGPPRMPFGLSSFQQLSTFNTMAVHAQAQAQAQVQAQAQAQTQSQVDSQDQDNAQIRAQVHAQFQSQANSQSEAWGQAAFQGEHKGDNVGYSDTLEADRQNYRQTFECGSFDREDELNLQDEQDRPSTQSTS